MIEDRIDCDLFKISPANPCPGSYYETAERNSRERDTDAPSAIADPLPNIGGYDTILLGNPVWNVRAPIVMHTFIEGFVICHPHGSVDL